MNLSFKLALAFLLAITPVILVRGWLSSRNEISLLEAAMRRNHLAVGSVLSSSLAYVSRDEGQARDFLAHADRRHEHLLVRWVSLDGPGAAGTLGSIGDSDRKALHRGAPITVRVRDDGAHGTLRTLVPVEIGGKRGAIEISESLRDETERTAAVIQRALVTGGIAAAAYVLASLVLGYRLVGLPARKLIDKARRVGAGDLSSPVDIRRRDELGEIGRELNAMSGRLLEAQQRLRQESEQRVAALEQLRHADRLAVVGKLAAGVAHELGTPINVVMARTKILLRSVDHPSVAEGADAILGQCRQMTKIIRQLLDFARATPPKTGTVDLRALARQTIALLATEGERQGVSLEVSAGDPVLADADAGQIQQVISNLVLNAIQASPSGGKVRVDTGVERSARPEPQGGGPEADHACIDVIDEGQGISDEHKQRLFEPFFTTKGVGHGTGLGLAVSHGIVREHRGWIEVRSEVGKGSTFSVHLPRGSTR